MNFYNKYFEIKKKIAVNREKDLRTHWLAIGVIFVGILFYFLNFAVRPFWNCKNTNAPDCEWQWFSDATGTWGEFGDFIGGTINPFIGLLTVILLVRSIRLTTDALKQNEEALEVSKDELIETRRAVEQATVAQKKMEVSLRDQLVLSKSQNNFANYFKHLEEFKIHMESLAVKADIDLRTMHKIIFPQCIDGEYRPSSELLKIFNSSRNLLFSQFKRLDGQQAEIIEITKNIEEIVRSFSVSVGNCVVIKELLKNPCSLKYDGKSHQVSVDNLYLHIQLNVSIFYCFEHALTFDVQGIPDIDDLDRNLCFLMHDHLAHAVVKKWGVIFEGELKHIYPLGKAVRD